MPRRDSGLLRDRRNIMGTSGNVFERLASQEGRPSTFFNTSKNLASSSQELRPDITKSGTYSHNGMFDYPRFPISVLQLGIFPDSHESCCFAGDVVQRMSFVCRVALDFPEYVASSADCTTL